jgi:hypothetical protein
MCNGRVDLRDARILTLDEVTTAMQAKHLVGRKTLRDCGLTAKTVAKRSRQSSPGC